MSRVFLGMLQIAAGAATVLGALLPWANVHFNAQVTSLLGNDLHVQLTGIQLDSAYATATIGAGTIAALSGLLYLADPTRLRGVALAGAFVGSAAVVATMLGVAKGQSEVASSADVLGPLGPIANLVSLANVMIVDYGIGMALSAIGGITATVAGVLAYRSGSLANRGAIASRRS